MTYTREDMAQMPLANCDDCGYPVDSYAIEGNEVVHQEPDGTRRQLCYDCQRERYNNACYIAGGVTEQQKNGGNDAG